MILFLMRHLYERNYFGDSAVDRSNWCILMNGCIMNSHIATKCVHKLIRIISIFINYSTINPLNKIYFVMHKRWAQLQYITSDPMKKNSST